MQVVDANGNVFGQGLEITGIDGKPKVPIINTDITIGTTVINGGVSGRLLFDDAGVVGETAGLNWNKITSVFTVGITGANGTIQFPTTTSGFVPSIISQFAGNNLIFTVGSRSLSMSGSGQLSTSFNTTITGSTGGTALTVAQGNSAWTPVADFNGSSGTALRINTNGNILVGTTTDAGFRLDVTGTTRLNGNITGVGTLGITIPSVNSFANGSITAVPSSWGRPFAVDFTIGAYTLTAMDSQIHFGTRFSGVYFNGSQMYTFGIPTQIWGGPTGPNNCSSLHIGVNSTTEYQVNTNYPSTADNFFYLSTVMVGSNGSIYTPPRANPTRRSFILSALEVIFHSGNTGVERGRIFSSGNWGINTTTDAGFRLDVNGTAAIRGITDIIGGTLRIASTGTLTQPSYITSHSDGGWNYTTYTHERGAGVHYFTSNNGSASIFSASAREGVNINVSSLNTGNPFSISGTVNASSAIARGQLINTTLVAAANNDVLVGLDVQPTFTNGAFTGVANYNIRNRALVTKQYFQSPTTNQGNHTIAFGFGGAGEQVKFIASAAGASGRGNLYIASTTGDTAVATTANANALFTDTSNTFYKLFSIDQAALTSGNGLVLSGNQPNGIINGIYFRYSETRVAILSKPHGANGYADFRIAIVPVGGANNPPVEADTKFMITKDTTNVLINTTTDAGFKLDVNGTARFSGQTFIQSAAGAVGLIADFGQTNSRIQFESHGSNDFTQIKIGNNFSLSRNGGSNPSISTTLNFDFKVAQINFSSLGNAPSRIFISGNYGLGSAYFGANNSNGTTASTLYFQNSVTPLAVQNVIATFNIWGMSDNATVPTTPASSMFALESTTRGFLPPRMTNAQMLAIATPAAGLIVYDTTNNKHYGYDGTTWNPFY
jgi:hypothetical protein